MKKVQTFVDGTNFRAFSTKNLAYNVGRPARISEQNFWGNLRNKGIHIKYLRERI
jgi:hypothetical protein